MDSLVENGRRLFDFLAALQKSKENPVEKTRDYERSGGAVLPLHSLGDYVSQSKIAVGSHIQEGFKTSGDVGKVLEDDPHLLIEFNRFNVSKFPAIPTNVKPWIVDAPDNSQLATVRRESIEREGQVITFAEESDNVKQSVNAWLQEWEKWAAEDLYQAQYDKAFELNAMATENADEFELVLGLGNLRWKVGNVDLDRHIFTAPLSINRESKSGRIRIGLLDPILKLEADSIPMEEVADSTFVNRVREALDLIGEDILLEQTFNEVANTTALSLTTRGQYSPLFSKAQAKSGSLDSPVLSWDPTIILRKRGKHGLSAIFSKIAANIEEKGAIPDGLAALIDPNRAVNTVEEPSPGGIFEVDNEIYSPLPLNSRQIEVLRRVDNYNQTIVQGPPGTGKTHMAAALLSHLLAQGKRVLVTAEKERALYELRDKLPEEIRELAVSVIGTQSAEQVELQNAISVIDSRAERFSSSESLSEIERHKSNLERLREDSIRLRRAWYNQLELENSSVDVEGYGDNLADAVVAWKEDKQKYEWIEAFTVSDDQQPFPLSPSQITELFAIHEQLSKYSVPEILSASKFEIEKVGSPEEFSRAIDEATTAQAALAKFEGTETSVNAEAWTAMPKPRQKEIEGHLSKLERIQTRLDQVNVPWRDEVVSSIERGQASLWQRELDELELSIANAKEAESFVSQFRKVEVEGNYSRFMNHAHELLKYVQSSGPLKTTASGQPKIGLMTKKVVKESSDFFQSVLVDGVPPTNEQTISAYVAFVNLQWELEKLPEVWPHAVVDANENSAKRIHAFESDAAVLRGLIQDITDRQLIIERVKSYGINADSIQGLQESLNNIEEYLQTSLSAKRAEEIVSGLSAAFSSGQPTGVTGAWYAKIVRAIEQRNTNDYEEGYRQYIELKEKGGVANHYQELLERVQFWSPTIHNALIDDDFSAQWKARLDTAEKARLWLLAQQKISAHSSAEFHTLQTKLLELDKEITREISSLAERRAWHQALSSNRIDANMRKTLKSYTQAVKRLGKGTGKNAEKRRIEVRRHLNNCRDAVPVWIMPISRVIEQFTIDENMFDVVIVDEASQAGMDAVFLQYLTKKIVVIGDDQQVSPSAVGAKEDEIEKLANQYIRAFDDRDSWIDPKRSLFDEADMRYGGRIVLNEHRRCVPEIIEFSNELTYRPNKIELLPVREVEHGRLAPFKITQTVNAPNEGISPRKTNRQEANVLVAKLLGCLKDPAYEGKTFGVISLLSSKAQIDYLRARLNEVVPPEVWDKRQLRVGNPSDFQGSERNVIFLSMVESGDPEARRAALTSQTYVQRYNVAVSRAKDQVQLFHSVGVENLPNVDDVRHKLLNYAYRVALSQPEIFGSGLVPNDERDERFDSLFEQRVYNRIAARGYAVQPQYRALNFNIDLVVEGNGRRLAIECDGDHWHSKPEDVEADRRRQSALERAGWKFVRIFESDFYLDENEQMERVWQMLEDLHIKPGQEPIPGVVLGDNIEMIDSVGDWMHEHGFEDGTPLLLTQANR